MLVVHEASMSISGDSSFILNWESCGFSMYIQPDSLLPGESCDVSVKAMLGGDFELPKDTILVSGVYRVSLSRDLHKPVTLELEHCVDIKTSDDCTSLQFMMGEHTGSVTAFKFVEGGKSFPSSRYGTISRERFCPVAVGYYNFTTTDEVL